MSDASVLVKYKQGKCKVPSGKFEKGNPGRASILSQARILASIKI
jgi:uncharacterized protein involved in exopolysaccharide biosynthesis